MTQLLMYVLPLMLGRTFDLNQMHVGVDIFPANETTNVEEYINTKSVYGTVTNSRDARNFLKRNDGVTNLYRLKSKAGLLKSGVVNAYLSEQVDRQNAVEIIITTFSTQLTESVRVNPKPISNWTEMKGLGTHFVRSITYGGGMIAFVRFICNGTKTKQLVINAVRPFTHYGFEREDKFPNNLNDIVESIQFKVLSSVPLKTEPKDLKSFQYIIAREFPELLKKQNGGKGTPMWVHLSPFSEIDNNWPKFIKSNDLDRELEEFEDKFDDLLNTKMAIEGWMKGLGQQLPTESKKKVLELYNNVLKVFRAFRKVIEDIDITSGPKQLDPALTEYQDRVLYRDFYRQYRKLREDTESNNS